MTSQTIDFTSQRKALVQLEEAIAFWQAQPDGSALKPHLRSAVIQSFEFSYELSVRMVRRVLIARADAADLVADLSFNELIRRAQTPDCCPMRWVGGSGARCATPPVTHNEVRAIRVATGATRFVPDATALLAALDTILPGAEVWVFGSRATGR